MLKIRPKFLITVLTIAIAIIGVNRYVCSLYRVSGTSMTPTMLDGDWCLVWKLGARHPQQGEIVFFRTANKPHLHFVKRIVAVPGQTISIEGGQMFVDGKPVDESYTKANVTWSLRPTRVPDDCYYFMGDHRAVPIENHLHGWVASRNIQGRVVAHWRLPLEFLRRKK